jgi:hypothetical protein
VLVADFRHFLGTSYDTPVPARRLGEQLAGIVQAASARESGHPWTSALSCRRRPKRQRCLGTIAVLRTDLPRTIEWRCTDCGDDGLIEGWEGSPFDLSGTRTEGGAVGRCYDIVITREDASVLRKCEFLDIECDRIVFGGRVQFGDVIVTGTHDGFEMLAEWVAAEANHEPNRRREKRLDTAYLNLTEGLRIIEESTSRSGDQGAVLVAKPTQVHDLLGKWRIEESDLWDRDALDLAGPALVEFLPDRTGSIRFIAVEGWLDCRPAMIDGRPGLDFSLEGVNEGDPVSGRGWAVRSGGDKLHLHLYFHMGDDSGFRASRFDAPSGL